MMTALNDRSPKSSVPKWLAGALNQAIDTLLHWYSLNRGRRDLASLDDRMLRDIGLSRADVDFEYGKPFWRG